MRRWISASLVIAALSAGGCRFCQGPDDYCGPVYWDGVPVIGFCERHNSVLSPGTFSTRSVPLDGEVLADDMPTEDEYVIESVDESPVINAPQEAAPKREPTPAPQQTPSPAQPPQKWLPPRSTPAPPKTTPAPGPIRTTRMNGS